MLFSKLCRWVNEIWGRMLFVLMATIVGFISWLLLRAAKLEDDKL